MFLFPMAAGGVVQSIDLFWTSRFFFKAEAELNLRTISDAEAEFDLESISEVEAVFFFRILLALCKSLADFR
jgi:hypothetical protein